MTARPGLVKASKAIKAITEARRRANARANAGKASRERHKREPTVIDWDAAIVRMRAMLDDLDKERK